MISKTAKQQIDKWITKYPKGKQQSAVMEALRLAQADNNGHLTPELIKEVANYLNIPNIAAYEVATFYENYNHKPVGKYVIRFCHNISCMLNGADDLITYLEQKLQIKVGQTTADGKFSLKHVECLAACVGAPMMQIGDVYYENLTKNKIDNILDILIK